jgi:hypothetical protein
MDMGTLSAISVVVLFYLIPALLVLRHDRRVLGMLLVLLLSWVGYAIFRFALSRSRPLRA